MYIHGSGANWLGLQLMLIRDSLQGISGWTSHICKMLDLGTGQPLDEEGANAW